jgi:hypothetical protein
MGGETSFPLFFPLIFLSVPLLSLSRTLYPELKEQLKELRKHLVESTNEMAPLKVWQMQGGRDFIFSLPLFSCIKTTVTTVIISFSPTIFHFLSLCVSDLSFQTAARILAAPSSDALSVMRDLSQNFPTKARYTHTHTHTHTEHKHIFLISLCSV